MFVSQGVLHCKVTINEQDFQQLGIPPVFRQEVLQALHDDLGHQGRDRTSLFKQRFFWPGMDAFVKEWEMARLKDSTRPCFRCWEPLKSTRQVVGSHMFQLLCKHITPPFTTALDFPHTSLCLGCIQDLQLMLSWHNS